MKKITLLLVLLVCAISFGQNRVSATGESNPADKVQQSEAVQKSALYVGANSADAICASPMLEVNQDFSDACMANISQTDLAQSYQPTEANSAGAGFHFESPPTAGTDLTLTLWDDLPPNGGTALASGNKVADGAAVWLDVFWDVTTVVPGDTYYIVITGSADACVSGSLSDIYPGGNVFANPGFVPFPQFDYTFRTYSCATSCITEDFETYVPPVGGAEVLGTDTLDETTVANGQGPGLVEDGCVYSSIGVAEMQWNDVGYFGQVSRNILSNDNTLVLVYDETVDSVDFNLSAFDGFGDSATIEAFDIGGVSLGVVGPLNVPDSTPVPVAFAVAGIKTINITGINPWSPLLNDHVFCPDVLGTDDNTIEGFGFYPNPTSSTINLTSLENIEAVTIYSMLGQKVVDQNIDATTSEINVSNLATGTYIMKVSVNGQVGTYRIIKQ